jgi:hypothetical protein
MHSKKVNLGKNYIKNTLDLFLFSLSVLVNPLRDVQERSDVNGPGRPQRPRTAC